MARRIDTQAVNEWIRLHEQGSTPASPAATYQYVFAKSDGLYIVDSGGDVTGPFGTGGSGGADILEVHVFS